jgi:hypothetical protein
MTIRKLIWWMYLVVLHLAVLFVLLLIPQVRHRFQMQKRLPGSRLSTQYDNRPDEWMRFILHDGRDPVLSIIDRPFGVEHIQVAPPDSQYVWSFDRNEGEDWKLFVADYGSVERADAHLTDPTTNHAFVDGYPNGGIDGFPDREINIKEDAKSFYQIEYTRSLTAD